MLGTNEWGWLHLTLKWVVKSSREKVTEEDIEKERERGGEGSRMFAGRPQASPRWLRTEGDLVKLVHVVVL